MEFTPSAGTPPPASGTAMGFFDYAAQHIIDFLDVFRRYRVDELVCVVVRFIAAFRANHLCFDISSLQA
jgi:hypothetical protein